MGYLHARGVRGFVTLNVLVFDDELDRAEAAVRACAAAGVDALIVQDVGAAALARRVAPGVHLHGSTQMSVASADGVRFAQGLGCERVVVGRELSVEEIASTVAGADDVEVEAFVHGALCVSYSGQCFSSEAWGGRSANRGQCAQACRLPYGLVVDGKMQASADAAYVLSPQDLAGVELVPALIAAGVRCLKIEGRLKGPEYVALATKTYREAVDNAWEELMRDGVVAKVGEGEKEENTTVATRKPPPRDLLQSLRRPIAAEQWRQLEQTFARGQDAEHRGLTPGFLEGSRHQRLVRGVAPRHRGAMVGEVVAVDTRSGSTRVDVRVAHEARVPRPGDGVVLASGVATSDEEGGALYGVDVEGDIARLTFGRGGVDPRRVRKGDLVWCTSDVALTKQLQTMAKEGRESVGGRTVAARAAGEVGAPLRVEYTCRATGVTGVAESASLLQEATSDGGALSEAKLRKTLGALGATTLRLEGGDGGGSVDTGALRLGQRLFLPAKELKAVRREAADALLGALREAESKAIARGEAAAAPPGEADAMRAEAVVAGQDAARRAANAEASARPSASYATETAVTVLCRTREQAQAACTLPWLDEVALDFLEVFGLKEAVEDVRAAGKRVVVATPRIIKPAEEHLWSFYVKLEPDALLVRGTGLLQHFVELGGPGARLENGVVVPRLHGDFSLNAANAVSVGQLLAGGALDRLCLTHDLSAAQLAGVAECVGPEGAGVLEAVAHMHLPVFHTEHCVFCRFLSDGENRSDCGQPCEQHSLRLRDEHGAQHLVLADQGCRNTIFAASAQSAARDARDLQAAGFGRLRVELVDESPEDTLKLLSGYRGVLRGEADPEELWVEMSTMRDGSGLAQGVTRGSLGGAGDRERASLKPTAYQM